MSSVNNVNNFGSNFPPSPNKFQKIEKDDSSKSIVGYSPFDEEQNMSVHIALKIFSYLDLGDLEQCFFVDKFFNKVANTDILDLTKFFPKLRIINRNLWEEKINMEKWSLSFGEEAPFNKNEIIPELKKFSALPIEDDAGITMINLPNITPSDDFTLNKFIEISKSLEQSDDMKFFSFISDIVQSQHGNKPIDINGTILLTNDVLEGSCGKTFDEQKQMVEDHECEVPEISHVLISNFFTYRSDEVRLFPSEPRMTYTRCSNMTEGNEIPYPTIVGNFSSVGLIVSDSSFDCACFGVAALRKF